VDLLIWLLLHDPKGLAVIVALLVAYFVGGGLYLYFTGRI
jgi:hypothetical protein